MFTSNSRLRRLVAGLLCAASVAVAAPGCKSQPAAPTGPQAETESPKDSPVAYKVLDDKVENNAVSFHVLVADGTRHDDVDALLKYLYRHLMQRREDEPASVSAYVYSTEAAYKTPPRTPIGTLLKNSGDPGPSFENKVPLEFRQEVDFAVHPKRENETEEAYARRRAGEEKGTLKLKIDRDDAAKTVSLLMPYTEPGKDEWAEMLSFNQAMNAFTDVAQSLFENVAELKQLTFSGTWKDKEVVHILITRADFSALKLNEIDERIGQHHGRVFLELATNRKSDEKAAKENAARIAKEYKAMLTALKGKAKVDPGLK